MSDLRTRQYTGGQTPSDPIGIVIGEAIETGPGQTALLALANATVRNHPIVYVAAPNAEHHIGDRLRKLGRATPTARIELVDRIPSDLLSIAIGEDAAGRWHLGANQFTAAVADHPVPIVDRPTSPWGAGLAAMLAANVVFRAQLELPLPELVPTSLWDLTTKSQMQATGPTSLGPIDVGSVWLIGAGGVGSSLSWWLSLLGVSGDWTIIDHDSVDDTNLNRSLGMLTTDLGRNKAKVAADLINATPFIGRWDEWTMQDPASPDLIIPAANDFGVRSALTTYSHPMMFSGTTSRNWTAELHLYRPNDGCPSCRHPETAQASLACSQAPIPTADGSRDAALSFLSGTAGLLTASGLARLQAGELASPANHWVVQFQPSRRTIAASEHTCDGGTPHGLSAQVRARVHGHTRWAS